MSSTGRITLRPMVDADRHAIRAIEHELAGDVMANVTPRTDEEFANHWHRMLVDPEAVSWVIERDAGEGAVVGTEVVGFVGTFLAEVAVSGDVERRRCIGYRVAQRWWGTGVATHATRLCVEEHVTERPLWAVTAATNMASQRVLSKCGFELIETRWSEATPRYPAGDESVFRLS